MLSELKMYPTYAQKKILKSIDYKITVVISTISIMMYSFIKYLTIPYSEVFLASCWEMGIGFFE
jgi:hypothetical protein